MAGTRTHVLTATDKALKAFFIAAAIDGLAAANIGRAKEVVDKTLPVLICHTHSALRKRAKNWEVSGTLTLKTDITDASGQVTDDQKLASDALELAVLEALETYIPGDDRPQPLAAAITSAAVAAEAVNSTEWLMTGILLRNVANGYDEEEIWTFSVDFTATVIA